MTSWQRLAGVGILLLVLGMGGCASHRVSLLEYDYPNARLGPIATTCPAATCFLATPLYAYYAHPGILLPYPFSYPYLYP